MKLINRRWKWVADIIFILSTMVDVELMGETQSKFSILGQGFTPKNNIVSEAIDYVIKDLSLSAK